MRLVLAFLLLGASLVWSEELEETEADSSAAPAETKYTARYSPHEDPYIIHEDDYSPSHGHGGGGKPAEEYIDSEDKSAHRENDEAQGNESLDKSAKDDEYNEQMEKEDYKEFEAGGVAFDKHLKDHKADNKELENVKQHDVGEKFGGEAVKEHKLGKHREKSKGHKSHGFKNVYHKEEYGDHKTFHDEFLDKDHLHDYDDHHEHKEMQGGKFSKAFKHEGKNKKYDKGDEKREWGKKEFDGHREGKREKGGQSSRQRQGVKKHQGQYDANFQRNKNAVKGVKKGNPPPYIPHVDHHGPHNPHIQPYVPHHHSQNYQAPVQPQHHTSHQYHIPEEPHHSLHGHEKQLPYNDENGSHESYSNSHSKDEDPDVYDGNYKKSHGSHYPDDRHREYHSSDDDDDHNASYEERLAKTPVQRVPLKEHDKHSQKPELVQQYRQSPDREISQKPEIHSITQPVVSVPQQPYRQPLQPLTYRENNQFKKPENFRPSNPFEDKFFQRRQRIHYGHQPRYSQHNRYHQQQQPVYHQHQQPIYQQRQPFPSFPGYSQNTQQVHQRQNLLANQVPASFVPQDQSVFVRQVDLNNVKPRVSQPQYQ